MLDVEKANDIYSRALRGETPDTTDLKLSDVEKMFWHGIAPEVKLIKKRGKATMLAEDPDLPEFTEEESP